MDPYKILGVEKGASEADIKKAYRKLAMKHHPDKAHSKEDEKKFKEVTEAYEILGDKQKKAQYDQFGATGRPGSGQGGFGGFDFSGFQNVDFNFGGGGFGDIFDSFFGGGARRAKSQQEPVRGNDIEIIIHLTFEEAVFGTTKEVEIKRYETCEHCTGMGNEPGSKIITCESCHGTGQQVRIQRTPLGQIQTSSVCDQCDGAGKKPEKKCRECKGDGRVAKNNTIKIRIPEGISDKSAIRISGKGDAGQRGGGYGDLFAHVSVRASKEFERDKLDIKSTHTVHFLQAILGDEISVKTIHGDVSFKLPSGADNGAVFKLKNYGVPKSGTGTRGDHYVKIEISTPKKLSKKERELYEELAKEAGLNIKPQEKGFFN